MRAALGVALLLVLGVGCESINSDEETFTRRPSSPSAVPFGGQTFRSSEASLPVTGGHLAVLEGAMIAAADPDSRELVLVNTSPLAIRSRHVLAGEPGRVVAGPGAVHVVLRDLGAIFTLDLASGRSETRPVCASPRGLGWDTQTDSLFVTCMDGRLQRLSASGGAATTLAVLEDDLRDVVPQPEGLWVTRFRAATAMLLSRDGARLRDVRIPSIDTAAEQRVASIAWRAVAQPGGGIVVSHQRHTSRTVSTVAMNDDDPFDGRHADASGYGGGFDPRTGECVAPLVTSALTAIGADGAVEWTSSLGGALPVDVAVIDGLTLVASAGMTDELSSHVEHVFEWSRGDFGCHLGGRGDFGAPTRGDPVAGQAVSVGQIRTERVVQTRFPFAIRVGQHELRIGADPGDVGNALFHAATTSNLACASCHPEGGEDGIRWTFFGIGTRRTQDLRGGILATAPFHWDGDVPSMDHIMNDVFNGRMGGGAPTASQLEAVATWVDALPLPAMEARGDAAHGRAVFEREGCADCHTGPQLTNNGFADFGRGRVQVPTLLGVALRSPWMHDGCAGSLEETVLGSCAGEAHGATSGLAAEDAGALLGYLRTL